MAIRGSQARPCGKSPANNVLIWARDGAIKGAANGAKAGAGAPGGAVLGAVVGAGGGALIGAIGGGVASIPCSLAGVYGPRQGH